MIDIFTSEYMENISLCIFQYLILYYIITLYLKFKLSNEKTSFVPRDNVIFYGISLKLMILQCSVRYYNIQW
jgi:hypothetical protein